MPPRHGCCYAAWRLLRARRRRGRPAAGSTRWVWEMDVRDPERGTTTSVVTFCPWCGFGLADDDRGALRPLRRVEPPDREGRVLTREGA